MKLSVTEKTVYFILLVMPATVTFLLIYCLLSATVFDFIPAWNDGDEIDYWHEILTFTVHSFSGGHYSIEELTPKASWSHFGTHGPAFPVLFGLVAKVVGWHLYSPVIFNGGIITAALAVFLYLVRPKPAQSIAVALVLLLFYPLQLYIPSAMQESLHHAIAITMAAVFYRLIATTETIKPFFSAATGLLLGIASLLRPPWAILFIPFFVITHRKQSNNWPASLLSGIGAITFFYLLFSYGAAPYPDNFVHRTLSRLASDPGAAWQMAITHATGNLKLFFSISDAKWFESMQRGIALVVLCYSLACMQLFSANNTDVTKRTARVVCLFIIFNISSMIALSILLYEIDGSREFRILAPHLLLSLLLLALLGKHRLIAATSVLYAAFLPTALTTYRESHAQHFTHPNATFEFGLFEPIARKLTYSATMSPWRNSLLIDVADYSFLLTQIPPGIGINAVMDWNRITYPLKSAYLLISPEQANRIAGKARLIPIANSSFRTLYLNLDCHDEGETIPTDNSFGDKTNRI